MANKMGPVILDLKGLELDKAESEILQHPLVGGVILFARNYSDPLQLQTLCKSIRKARSTPLLISVDQEGGRVQRFKEGFTRLPPMGLLGQFYETNPEKAAHLAQQCGWLMASELLACGVDLSLAPVLDLNKKCNTVIGDRAFSHDPNTVAFLAKKFIQGMRKAGMAATGKHFPGHGSVKEDSHHALPIDINHLQTIAQEDLVPFSELIQSGIDAMMPAHILFPEIDDKPVGFSPFWLKTILRQQLKFDGVIFSDDLNMEGSAIAGDYVARAEAALQAGCDFVLICNNPQGAVQILEGLAPAHFVSQDKMQRLQGKFSLTWEQLHETQEWQEATKME